MPRRSLAVQFKFDLCSRAGLAIAGLHFFELPDPVDLFDLLGIKLLEQLIAGIVGFGMDNNNILGPTNCDPGKVPRLSIDTRLGINALKHITG